MLDRREFLKTGCAALGLLSQPARNAGRRPAAPGRMSRARHVIVVGAGLAGLSAAYELTRSGHRVTVLEAQLRPGGRVLTLREPFADGLHAEAGATHIPDTHDLTLHYIRMFELPLVEPAPNELRWVEYLRGSRIIYEHDDDTPEHPYDLAPNEAALGHWGMLAHAQPRHVLDEIGDIRSAEWPVAALEAYDHLTYAEYLRSHGFSSEAIALIGASLHWGDGPDSVSALAVLRDSVHQRAAQAWYAVRGGNDLLPHAFAARLHDSIRYGAPVVRVERDDSGVRAIFRHSGTCDSITGDYLICAIPFSVLRGIDVVPPFSPGKTSAIRDLPYFSAARVALQCRTRFWEAHGLAGSGLSDLGVGSFMHMTADQPGPRGIVQCYVGGPDARLLCTLGEDERIDFVVQELEMVFPGLRRSFEIGVSTCWDQDPWARGASSWYAPGQMTELWPHVASPEGRVHFAGDHTSPYIRWMQGALHSGLRVAREIAEAEWRRASRSA